MCHFISWIDLEGQLYYLTSKELRSKRGKELKDYLGSAYAEDVVGHGAIDWYFDLKGRGEHKECTDFSSPNNFPDEIVKAIKSGAFKGIGVCPAILNESARADYLKIEQSARADYEKIKQSAWADYEKITQSAWADYQKIIQSARADYQKIIQSARADYQKIIQSAWADYEKIIQSAWADYEKITQPARADYEKIEQPAWADYQKIEQPARADYEKIEQPARADYEKIKHSTFWCLAIESQNRITAWTY